MQLVGRLQMCCGIRQKLVALRPIPGQFAERARSIAQADGLPIEKYIRLTQQRRTNLREMLQVIERDGMVAKAE